MSLRSERLSRPEPYINLAIKYFAEAHEYLDRNECEKASESLWGSLAAALNAISSARTGKPLLSHQELKLFARQLSVEINDPEIYRVFRETERLHASFYHAFFTIEDLVDLLPRIGNVVRKILSLIRL